jgi:DNA-binding GntR family transcriptional regulator
MTSIARDVGQEHQSLVDAALKRNAARAELLLTGHLRETTRILTEALKMAAGGRSAVLGARRSKERRRA